MRGACMRNRYTNLGTRFGVVIRERPIVAHDDFDRRPGLILVYLGHSRGRGPFNVMANATGECVCVCVCVHSRCQHTVLGNQGNTARKRDQRTGKLGFDLAHIPGDVVLLDPPGRAS
jgi:hypothetical protein